MRRFVDLEMPGRPATHVLVIGVGTYPHLSGGAARQSRVAGNIRQLTSPPVSASAIADWFETEYQNPDAALGTLELLISDADDRTADQPTMRTIRAAVHGWKERADSHVDNIAVLYFCGHGISIGVHNGLLAADFGATDDSLLAHVVDIDGLQLAMDNCRARRQLFLIDACRNTPHWLAELVTEGGIGDPVLDRRWRQGRFGSRDAPRFFASRPNESAYGRPGRISVFTEALLETLSNAGAARTAQGEWVVRTDTILPGLTDTLSAIARRDGVPPVAAMQDHSSAFQLHFLSGPPDVSVRVSCDPLEANGVADFALRSVDDRWRRRTPPAPDHWLVKCPAGVYDVHATFAGREYRDVSRPTEVVWPPVTDFILDVRT